MQRVAALQGPACSARNVLCVADKQHNASLLSGTIRTEIELQKKQGVFFQMCAREHRGQADLQSTLYFVYEKKERL